MTQSPSLHPVSKCTLCGTPSTTSVKACSSCGTLLEKQDETRQPSRLHRIIFCNMIFIASCLLAVMCAYTLHSFIEHDGILKVANGVKNMPIHAAANKLRLHLSAKVNQLAVQKNNQHKSSAKTSKKRRTATKYITKRATKTHSNPTPTTADLYDVKLSSAAVQKLNGVDLFKTRVLNRLNKSIEPCENFYQHVCSNHFNYSVRSNDNLRQLIYQTAKHILENSTFIDSTGTSYRFFVTCLKPPENFHRSIILPKWIPKMSSNLTVEDVAEVLSLIRARYGTEFLFNIRRMSNTELMLRPQTTALRTFIFGTDMPVRNAIGAFERLLRHELKLPDEMINAIVNLERRIERAKSAFYTPLYRSKPNIAKWAGMSAKWKRLLRIVISPASDPYQRDIVYYTSDRDYFEIVPMLLKETESLSVIYNYIIFKTLVHIAPFVIEKHAGFLKLSIPSYLNDIDLNPVTVSCFHQMERAYPSVLKKHIIRVMKVASNVSKAVTATISGSRATLLKYVNSWFSSNTVMTAYRRLWMARLTTDFHRLFEDPPSTLNNPRKLHVSKVGKSSLNLESVLDILGQTEAKTSIFNNKPRMDTRQELRFVFSLGALVKSQWFQHFLITDKLNLFDLPEIGRSILQPLMLAVDTRGAETEIPNNPGISVWWSNADKKKSFVKHACFKEFFNQLLSQRNITLTNDLFRYYVDEIISFSATLDPLQDFFHNRIKTDNVNLLEQFEPYTSNQIFFIGLANSMCEKRNAVDRFRQRIAFRQSLPAEILTNDIIMNTASFKSTFHCYSETLTSIKQCSYW